MSDEHDGSESNEAADRATFLADVRAGLSAQPKHLPCKHLYDERGSQLFEAICELPEYYPTRSELQILERHAPEMAQRIGPDATLIELGSGAGVKVRLLLDALDRPAAYVPIDISRAPLEASAAALRAAYPHLAIHSIHADYTQPLELHLDEPFERRTVFFPGSTLGNFEPEHAVTFVRRIRSLGSGLLLGLDLDKDPSILEAAYNDSQGVTAEFNKNVLRRINRELGGDFDLDQFRHEARYNQALRRVEMHLVSLRRQQVHVGTETFHFDAGESIHTESSHKYRMDDVDVLARQAGYVREATWTDADEPEEAFFSVHFFRAVGSS
jgi:dimethylhistidine N-methyltransferase